MVCGRSQCQAIQIVCRVWYPEYEGQLYMRFHSRRQVLGLKTGDKRNSLSLKASILGRFRWWSLKKDITSLLRCGSTNKVSLPIAQKLASIWECHRRFAALRSSGLTRCPKYGRFRADQYFHMVYHSYFLRYHISFLHSGSDDRQ